MSIPLHISRSGRYFTDLGGKPAFWLGDTQWELFRCFTPDTAMPILRDRRAKGFNAILIMLTGVDHGRLYPAHPQTYTNLNGDAPWEDNDPLRPNERYFRHVDRLIGLGEPTDHAFVVGIYHQWHRDIITPANARAWARWVGQRYRDVPNLIWSMYPRAEEGFVPVCRELAAGLQEGDAGKHLISVHPDPAVASSSFLHSEPWLAFNMIQTCIDYEKIIPAVTADYRRIPVKPVVMAEGGYEGTEFDRVQTAYEIRKQAYWSQLAGGFHVYGHNDAWTAPERAHEWLDSAGSRHLGLFCEIITGLDAWWTMAPDHAAVLGGAGQDGRLALGASSADAGWHLIYISEPATVTLEPTVAACPRKTWIDPRTGDRIPATTRPGGSNTLTTPAEWEDALILAQH